MANLELGQDWLAQPHPLQSYQLVQGTIKTAVEPRSVANEELQAGTNEDLLPKHIQLHPFGLDRGSLFPMVLEPLYFLHELFWEALPAYVRCCVPMLLTFFLGTFGCPQPG